MIASSSAPESRRLLLLFLVSCSCRPSELGGNEVWLRDQSVVERQDRCFGANALQAYGTTHLSVFLASRSSVLSGLT